MKSAVLFLLVLFVPRQEAQTIKIVSSLPMTGGAAAQTRSIVNGIKMAIEEVDSKVGTFKIQFVEMDSASAASPPDNYEADNASKAVKDPNVMVYIGTYNSGMARISMPITNEAGLLMISPGNMSPSLTRPGEELKKLRPTGKINYCRVIPTDDVPGVVAADWALKLGRKAAFVVDDKEDYGHLLADAFQVHAKAIRLSVVGREGVDAQQTEFGPLLAKIMAAKADVVYFGGTTNCGGAAFVKALVATSLDCKLIVSDGCYEEDFILNVGADKLNGRLYTVSSDIPSDQLKGKAKVFVEAYRKKYGKNPEAYAIYGYEAARVALAAIRSAAKWDRDAICAACLNTKNFDGVLGTWSFDEHGDTTSKFTSGYIVKDGKFTFAELLGK